MARDYLSLGPTPAEESCQQVGTTSYNPVMARAECQAYRNQLYRVFGTPPEGASVRITSNPHEFGSYLDVVVYYDPENEAATEWAFRLESDSPGQWDAEARKELGLDTPQ